MLNWGISGERAKRSWDSAEKSRTSWALREGVLIIFQRSEGKQQEVSG